MLKVTVMKWAPESFIHFKYILLFLGSCRPQSKMTAKQPGIILTRWMWLFEQLVFSRRLFTHDSFWLESELRQVCTLIYPYAYILCTSTDHLVLPEAEGCLVTKRKKLKHNQQVLDLSLVHLGSIHTCFTEYNHPSKFTNFSLKVLLIHKLALNN